MSPAGLTGCRSGPTRRSGPAEDGLGIEPNVSGVPRVAQWSRGQTTTNALPITLAIGTGP